MYNLFFILIKHNLKLKKPEFYLFEEFFVIVMLTKGIIVNFNKKRLILLAC